MTPLPTLTREAIEAVERLDVTLAALAKERLHGMTKIVYNGCYGGFGLSDEGLQRYCEIKGYSIERKPFIIGGNDHTEFMGPVYVVNGVDWYSSKDIPRTDPALVQVVEEMGAAAGSRFAALEIRELPAGTRYRIDEYDGFESVVTVDEYEWSVA